MSRLAVILSASILLAPVTASAEPFSILTWNVREGSVEQMARRSEPLSQLRSVLAARNFGKPLPDVIVLQEVTSFAAAREVASQLGYATATIATSDSGNDREIWPLALEVAVITSVPVAKVTAYQSNPNPTHPPYVHQPASGPAVVGEVVAIPVPAVVPVPAGESVPRAVLRVELANGVVVYAVHLNSSGLGFCRIDEAVAAVRDLADKARSLGLADVATTFEGGLDRIRTEMRTARSPGIAATRDEAIKRARLRESAAGAVAVLAAKDLAEGRSVVVAGDFNTPLLEPCKTGQSLADDVVPEAIGCQAPAAGATCPAGDGYDDTYAILTRGLVEGVALTVKTAGIGRTFAAPGFVDEPIDNILIGGPLAARPGRADKLGTEADRKVFGSDHYPVLYVAE